MKGQVINGALSYDQEVFYLQDDNKLIQWVIKYFYKTKDWSSEWSSISTRLQIDPVCDQVFLQDNKFEGSTTLFLQELRETERSLIAIINTQENWRNAQNLHIRKSTMTSQ